MPNQSDPNQPTANPPAVTPPMDLPPLPQDFASANQTPVASTPPPIDQGSAAPPETPPIISGTPKKKFGGGRIIATILGVLLLVGGVGAGYVLTQQPQLFQQLARECVDSSCSITYRDNKNGTSTYNYDKARDRGVDTNIQTILKSVDLGSGSSGSVIIKTGTEGPDVQVVSCSGSCLNQTTSSTTDNDCSSDGICPGGSSCVNGACVSSSTSCKIGDVNAPGCCANLNEADCSNVVCENGAAGPRKECKTPSGQHCTLSVGSSTGCGGANSGTTTNETGTAPACLNVTAYSSTWTALNNTELSALTADTQVNFCVAGSNGTFDQAEFKINTTATGPISTKGQGAASSDFCQSYTITAADIGTTNHVLSKIHDATSNTWVGESF